MRLQATQAEGSPPISGCEDAVMVGDFLRQRVLRNLAPEGTIRRDLIHLLKGMLRGHQAQQVAPAVPQSARTNLASPENQAKQGCFADVAPAAAVAKDAEP